MELAWYKTSAESDQTHPWAVDPGALAGARTSGEIALHVYILKSLRKKGQNVRKEKPSSQIDKDEGYSSVLRK